MFPVIRQVQIATDFAKSASVRDWRVWKYRCLATMKEISPN
ncbi:hypothetical protein [Candidatus Nitrotoga fabula]